MALVHIQTLDELKKILFVQRLISRQAKEELLSVSNDELIEDLKGNKLQTKVNQCIEDEKNLLVKYVNYPTFSEFNQSKALLNLTQWGSSFGVAVLINELVLEQTRLRIGSNPFLDSLRKIYVLILKELHDPRATDIVEALEKTIKAKFVDANGKVATQQTTQKAIRKSIENIVLVVLHFSFSYGIISMSKNDHGYKLTPLGRRTYLHLKDILEFVEILTSAHSKFREAPKLSTT
jgi:DNA-binding transcriptional LysR family regulator